MKETNISRLSSLDLSKPTHNSAGEKGRLRDFVAKKGIFLVLGVVGNVGVKAG